MALVIKATSGAVDANSYCTLAESDAYHESRLHTDSWDDADDDTKNRALASATRLLDSHITWDGYPASEAQALQWPRTALYDSFDNLIDEATIPQVLKNATAEFALHLIDDDLVANVSSEGIEGVGLGPIKVDFSATGQKRNVIPDIVLEMLDLWIYDTPFRASGCSVRFVRS